MGKRIENWAIVLGNELQKPRKFIWGIEDCCLFSAYIVNTITNIDVAQSYRGKYYSKISAFKMIKKRGYKNLVDLIDAEALKHGFFRIDKNFAQKGDVVSKKIKDDEIIGIMLDDVGVFLNKDKYVYTKRDKLNLAWAIR